MNQEREETMLDLLCKKAVYGLDQAEEMELAELLRSAGPGYEPESFELTVAALGLLGVNSESEMPANLRSRVSAEAERYFDNAEQERAQPPAAAAPQAVSSFGLPSWLGWAVAAAACIALAVNLFLYRPAPEIARTEPPAVERLTTEQQRQRLIESARDLARAVWEAGNVKGMSPTGDVVWSDSAQAGFMRFRGLPPNDKGKETYQLWIFDETQDEKTPIDGGTFDVDSSGEVIVPIDAKLKARNPKAFAITIEKPGGVVVSKREKVAALAKRTT